MRSRLRTTRRLYGWPRQCTLAALSSTPTVLRAASLRPPLRCVCLLVRRCGPSAIALTGRSLLDSLQDQYQRVIDDATEALRVDPVYVKALIRRAKAYEAIDKLSEALQGARLVVMVLCAPLFSHKPPAVQIMKLLWR